MNSEYNYERTVDLVSFLKAVFIHWRRMLVLGVIFAIILGMIPIVEYKKENQGQSNEKTADKSQEYLTKEEYNATLARLEKILAEKRRYIAESYLMKIDPFNEIVVREQMFIDLKLDQEMLEDLDTLTEAAGLEDSESEAAGGTTETGTADTTTTDTTADTGTGDSGEEGSDTEVTTGVEYLTSRVLREYILFLNTGIDWTELADELGTKPIYLDECVSIDCYMDASKMIISVRGYDEEIAYKIRDYAVEKMKEKKVDVERKFCAHDIRYEDAGMEIRYSSGTRSAQDGFINEISTAQTRYDNFKNSRGSFVYSAPVQATLDKKAVLTDAIIGFLAGILLGALISAVMIFARGRVISSKELQLSYDLKSLASLNSCGKAEVFSGVDRWIENIGMGSDGKLSDDEKMLKAAQMIELYAFDADKIVLTGDVSEEDLKITADRLQKNLKDIQLEYCNSLLGNTALLRDSNGVILVEKKNESRLGKIENDIGIVGEMKIPVIGTVLL